MAKTRYYLREGDFRPEVFDTPLSYRNEREAAEQLALAGNLFDSKEEAAAASFEIRTRLRLISVLREERRAYNRQCGKPIDNGLQPSRLTRLLQIFAEGTQDFASELQSPSAQIGIRPSDDSSPAHGSESDPAIH